CGTAGHPVATDQNRASDRGSAASTTTDHRRVGTGRTVAVSAPPAPRSCVTPATEGKRPGAGAVRPHPSRPRHGGTTVATAHAGGNAGPSRIHALAQYVAFAFGGDFTLVGVLGFIPGITTNVDDMTFAVNDSGAELLGIFQVSVLHNLVHLLLGIVGLWAARLWATARVYLLATGVVYLALFVRSEERRVGKGAMARQ